MKNIVLLEFKRTSDSSESYFQDMWKVTKKQYTPILKDLGDLVVDREWEVEVVPLVVGERSVKEKEWSETFKIFGIRKEDGKRIINRLGHTLLKEYEELFGNYWWHTFGSSRVPGERHIGPFPPASPGRLKTEDQL
jgi:hypothetical protein